MLDVRGANLQAWEQTEEVTFFANALQYEKEGENKTLGETASLLESYPLGSPNIKAAQEKRDRALEFLQKCTSVKTLRHALIEDGGSFLARRFQETWPAKEGAQICAMLILGEWWNILHHRALQLGMLAEEENEKGEKEDESDPEKNREEAKKEKKERKERNCFKCGRPSFRRCTCCHRISYCGLNCQREDRSLHKLLKASNLLLSSSLPSSSSASSASSASSSSSSSSSISSISAPSPSSEGATAEGSLQDFPKGLKEELERNFPGREKEIQEWLATHSPQAELLAYEAREKKILHFLSHPDGALEVIAPHLAPFISKLKKGIEEGGEGRNQSVAIFFFQNTYALLRRLEKKDHRTEDFCDCLFFDPIEFNKLLSNTKYFLKKQFSPVQCDPNWCTVVVATQTGKENTDLWSVTQCPREGLIKSVETGRLATQSL